MPGSAIPPIPVEALDLPWVNVVDFGAVADNVTNDTGAFNAAIAAAGPTGTTYVPPGTYLILGQIELNGGDEVNWPARLIGAGSKLSVLHITAAALANQTVGTIQAARGVWISDLRFVYDQPDPGGNLNAVPQVLPDYTVFNRYKPVIYVNQTFIVTPTSSLNPEYGGKGFYRGGRYERLRIELAWDGITCVGGPFDNSLRPFFGQEIFDDLEMGTLRRGLDLDMLTDSCYINRLRVFPYGMTGNQETAQRLPGHSVGIWAGKLDDTRVANSFFLAPALDAHPGLNGDGVHLTFVNCSFDSFAHVEIEGGTTAIHGFTSFTGCRFGNAPAASPQDVEVRIHNQDVYFENCYFVHTNVGTNDCIATANDTEDNKVVSFNNCKFWLGSNDVSAITGTGNLILSNCHFQRTPTGIFTVSTIHVGDGGRATITDNQGTPMTTGSVVFLHLDADDYHMVSGNVFPGWDVLYPVTVSKVKSLNNTFETGSNLLGGTNIVGRPAIQTGTSATPGGTSSTGMVGLGYTLTPAVNGKVFAMISGSCVSDAANQGGNLRLRWGTGTAPSNGAAVTGSQLGGIAERQAGSWPANTRTPFALSGIISTSAGTRVWVDLQQTSVGSGNFSVKDVAGVLFELP